MMSTRHRFIYLHAPKTGGNSILGTLLPHSDDRKVMFDHMDGIDRLSIAGPITPGKHAGLADYAARGVDVEKMFVFISARHPFARALSFYFSPHRWARRDDDGAWSFARPTWDHADFAAFIDDIPGMVDFLRVDGAVRTPDDVIRLEHIGADFARVIGRIGLPTTLTLPHRNKAIVESAVRTRAWADDRARDIVARRFAEDFSYFGY